LEKEAPSDHHEMSAATSTVQLKYWYQLVRDQCSTPWAIQIKEAGVATSKPHGVAQVRAGTVAVESLVPPM
jgi:hypothetical protein